MIFKELAGILKKGDTVTLTLAVEDAGQCRVNLYPKLFTMDGEKGEDRKALNQPLTVTGTADELDSPEFIATIQKYTASITGLRSTLDEAETSHKAAATAAKGKSSSSSSSSSKGKPVTKTPTGGAAKPSIPPKPAAPKPAAKLPARPAAGKGQPAKPATVAIAPVAADVSPLQSSAEAPAGTATKILAENPPALEAEAAAAPEAPEPRPETPDPTPKSALEATEDLI